MLTKHRTGYLFQRGDNWYVRWTMEGKRFTKALRDANGHPITSKREAEKAQHKIMAPVTVATEADVLQSITARLEGRKAELDRIEDAKTTATAIKSAWSVFLASPDKPDCGESTRYQYECQWTAFVEWIEKNYPAATELRLISRDVAREYAASLNHGRLSPNTYNKHLNLLTLVFRVLKHEAKLAVNHWVDLPRKRLAPQGRRELKIEELRKVCQSATGDLRLLLAIGVYTGLRLGDCCTLRWCECDLTRGIITRKPNKTALTSPDKVVQVPIHPALRAMMAEIPEQERGDYVLPELAAMYEKRIDAVTDLVQRHVIGCGIKTHKPGTGKDGKRAVVEVGFHSLRHSFVSLCRASNTPLSVVQSLVGHGSPAMTRHYTHVGELAAGSAVAALPSIVGDAKQPEQPQPKAVDSAQVKALVDAITAQNWREQKAALLALL